MPGKLYTQIPPPQTSIIEDPFAQLSEQEQELYHQVFNHFSNDAYTIPDIDNDAQLSEKEKFWLSRECFLRFLRASKWDSQTAIERVEKTLKWRREIGLYDLITAESVEAEAMKHKEIVYGYDAEGRPAYYIVPSRLSSPDPLPQVHLAIWMMERCIDLMRPGVETITLLIDFADASLPTFTIARSLLSIIQEHYPEHLGKTMVINLSFFVNTFIKLIWPFVDPRSRVKTKFNPEVVNEGYFTSDMLITRSWGGTADFEYEHDKYWPALISLCEEMKQQRFQRWRSLGGTIGIREWDYKREGGAAASEQVTEQAAKSEPKGSSDCANGQASDFVIGAPKLSAAAI
ncbi:CRAL/TRIO domain containing protein [Amanita muscaria]